MNDDHMKEPEAEDVHELYQELEQEQPPAALDAQILQAAHRAAAESTQTVVDIRSARRTWYVPVSYAAIILISVSLVIKLSLEPELQLPEQDSELPTELMRDDVGGSLPAVTEFKAKESAESTPETAAPSAQRMELRELSKQQQAERKKKQRVMMAKPMSAPAPEVEELSRSKPAASLLSEQADVAVEALNGAIPEASAEDWIVQMQALLSAQQYDALWQSLRAFRQQYPDYTLPEELANWLVANPATE